MSIFISESLLVFFSIFVIPPILLALTILLLLLTILMVLMIIFQTVFYLNIRLFIGIISNHGHACMAHLLLSYLFSLL